MAIVQGGQMVRLLGSSFEAVGGDVLSALHADELCDDGNAGLAQVEDAWGEPETPESRQRLQLSDRLPALKMREDSGGLVMAGFHGLRYFWMVSDTKRSGDGLLRPAQRDVFAALLGDVANTEPCVLLTRREDAADVPIWMQVVEQRAGLHAGRSSKRHAGVVFGFFHGQAAVRVLRDILCGGVQPFFWSHSRTIGELMSGSFLLQSSLSRRVA